MDGQLRTEKSYELTLKMNGDELRTLTAMMQNPHILGESIDVRNIREKLWDILNPPQPVRT